MASPCQLPSVTPHQYEGCAPLRTHLLALHRRWKEGFSEDPSLWPQSLNLINSTEFKLKGPVCLFITKTYVSVERKGRQ